MLYVFCPPNLRLLALQPDLPAAMSLWCLPLALWSACRLWHAGPGAGQAVAATVALALLPLIHLQAALGLAAAFLVYLGALTAGRLRPGPLAHVAVATLAAAGASAFFWLPAWLERGKLLGSVGGSPALLAWQRPGGPTGVRPALILAAGPEAGLQWLVEALIGRRESFRTMPAQMPLTNERGVVAFQRFRDRGFALRQRNIRQPLHQRPERAIGFVFQSILIVESVRRFQPLVIIGFVSAGRGGHESLARGIFSSNET